MVYLKQATSVSFGLFVIFSFALFASAEPLTLENGTKVKPVIRVIDAGEYDVNNKAPGRLKPNADAQVPKLPEQPKDQKEPPVAPDAQMQVIINKILASPELMADIEALATDEDAMAVISDPAFIKATQSKNIEAVESSPRTEQLMKNPKIKSLIEKIQALK